MNKDDEAWGAETRITKAAGASILPTVAADAAEVSIVWTDLRHGNADLYFIESEEQSDVPRDIPAAAGSRLVYLYRPYPMPFTSEARVAFSLAERARVTLEVFDVRGRLVKTLAQGSYGAGSHSMTWDGCDNGGRAAASGVYFIRCASADESHVRSAVLVR
jgi:hypothetical protein